MTKIKQMGTQTQFPYSDRLVCRKIDVEVKTKGGILLGEIERDAETMIGKVVAVGRGKWTEKGLVPMETKVGDVVIMTVRAPIRINIKGENFYVINEINLLINLKDPEIQEKE